MDCEECGEQMEKKEICYYKTKLICPRCFYRFNCDGKSKRQKEKLSHRKISIRT